MSGLLQEQPIYSHRQVQLPARAATAEAETPHHEAWDVTGMWEGPNSGGAQSGWLQVSVGVLYFFFGGWVTVIIYLC